MSPSGAAPPLRPAAQEVTATKIGTARCPILPNESGLTLSLSRMAVDADSCVSPAVDPYWRGLSRPSMKGGL